MNPTLQTIHSRRSVRRFKNEQITDNELDTVIQAGRHAPSGGNNQTCHIIVVQNKEVIEQLKQLAIQLFSAMEVTPTTYKSLANSINASKKGAYDFTQGAPTLIIVANKTNYGNAMADSACMLENMLLAAHSISLGACWNNQTHWLTDEPLFRAALQKLGMQEDQSVYGGLVLGYPDTPSQPPLERKGNNVTYIR